MKLRIFLLITLLSSLLTANEKLVFDWITPLKHDQAFETHREYAGAVIRDTDIVVALRSGELVVVNSSGRIVFRRQYEGTHTTKPMIDAEDNTLYLSSGSSFRALDTHYDEKWYISFRAPIATRPLIDGDLIYLATLDNSVYAINKKTGKIVGSYTSYDTVPLSYIHLADPLKIDDKIVFGFANGTILFFMIKEDGPDAVNIIPYFRFRTKKSTISSGHRFYDLFSIKGNVDHLLFSNGELGGKIIAGKTQSVPHMENIILTNLQSDNSYIGYGQQGVFRFSEKGNFKQHLFQTKNFVTGLLPLSKGVIVTTTGEPTFLARREGALYFLNSDYSEILDATMIPSGISSNPVQYGDDIIVLTNAGALMKIIIKENR